MKILIRFLIIFHFFLIFLTVSHLHKFITNPVLLGANDAYSAITYTNRCFGFFAPEVGNDLVIQMNMSNKQKSLPFHIRNDNFEMRTRLYSLTGHFAEDNQQSTMDLFARSWGVKCLNDNPDMEKVNIIVLQNNIPTMSEYAQGKRITQDTLYSTDVELY